MTETVTVRGGRELADSLDRAADELDDLSRADRRAESVLVPRARANAPVLTGALRASVRADRTTGSATVVAGSASVPYAGIVHARNPFMTRALADESTTVVEVYGDEVARIVNKIRGV